MGRLVNIIPVLTSRNRRDPGGNGGGRFAGAAFFRHSQGVFNKPHSHGSSLMRLRK